MKNQYYQFLLTILFYTILNAAVVASLSSKNKADKLGLSSNFNLGDNSNKEDLALAWPEVKSSSSSSSSSSNAILDVPSVDTVDKNLMRFAQVPKEENSLPPTIPKLKRTKGNIYLPEPAANNKVFSVNGSIVNDAADTTGYRWDKIKYKGAAPAKREGHTSVAVEDYIITFGGCYLDKRCFNDLHVFNTRTNDWVQPKVDGLPPIEREGHTATMVGQLMYVYGGSSEVGYLDDVYVLNVNPGTPGSGEELPMSWGHIDVSGVEPIGREGHSAVQYGSRIIYFGGYTEKGFTNELLILDTTTNAWQIPAVSGVKPAGREGHTALVYNNRMYVFGGFTNGGCLNDLYILDLKTMSWEIGITSGITPSVREDHSAILRGHEMLFVGGCNFGKGKCFCDLNILNLKNLMWREEKTKGVSDDLVVTPREDHTMTMVRGKAFLFGGCYLAQKCYNDVYKLEPSTGAMICGNNKCSGHGVCRKYANMEKMPANQSTYACACAPGYTGEDCSEVARCPGDCSGHGMCKSNYQCSCNNGWTLKDCSLQIKCPGVMKDNLALGAMNLAKQMNGATLFMEVKPIAKNNNTKMFVPCSGNGECRLDGHCECKENWYGIDCSKNRICPNDCSGHGVCAGPAKAEAIKKALIIAAAADHAVDVKIAGSPADNSSLANSSFIEENSHLPKNASTSDISKTVYCHCDEGFSAVDCSYPEERIMPISILLSLSMKNMRKAQLWRSIEQGWGTNLVVAISNFVGVSPERLLIKLKGETFVNKDSALLVETASSTRRRLGGRNTILNGNNLPPLKAIIPNEKKIMIKENAILINVTIRCRGLMQQRAVEEQLRLRHAAGILEIFLDKQLPSDAPQPFITLLKSSISGLFAKRVNINVASAFDTGKKNKKGNFNPQPMSNATEGNATEGNDTGDNVTSLDGDAGQRKNLITNVKKAAISKSNGIFSTITSSISKLLPKSNHPSAPPHAICPSECAKHGICNSGKCYCFQGYQGSACTVTARKEFLQAEQSLINNGVFKWAAGSFFVGFSAIVAIYPVYKRILQEKNRKKQLSSGPMITSFKRRYR